MGEFDFVFKHKIGDFSLNECRSMLSGDVLGSTVKHQEDETSDWQGGVLGKYRQTFICKGDF